MSIRGREFSTFASIVIGHIENYTVAQYGDAPFDPVQQWPAQKCVDSMSRYVSRFNSNRRGRIEQLRDLVKIAHYAAMTLNKLEPTPEEIEKLKLGES